MKMVTIGFRVLKGYIGIMEKKMETTIMGFIGYIMGSYWDNKPNSGSRGSDEAEVTLQPATLCGRPFLWQMLHQCLSYWSRLTC